MITPTPLENLKPKPQTLHLSPKTFAESVLSLPFGRLSPLGSMFSTAPLDLGSFWALGLRRRLGENTQPVADCWVEGCTAFKIWCNSLCSYGSDVCAILLYMHVALHVCFSRC